MHSHALAPQRLQNVPGMPQAWIWLMKNPKAIKKRRDFMTDWIIWCRSIWTQRRDKYDDCVVAVGVAKWCL